MNKAEVVFLVLLNFDATATSDLYDRFHDFLPPSEMKRIEVFAFDSANVEAS